MINWTAVESATLKPTVKIRVRNAEIITPPKPTKANGKSNDGYFRGFILSE
jgi:hypothetical protein